MDSTRRPTGCPCGEGILNKPKNGTSCHLPANRKFLFHAHFSLQKDFFSNFLSAWFMYFVTESSCFHLVLKLISKEQQKGKIFQFKKIIFLQRGAASCSIIWELDVDSFCQLTTGPLSELVAHCWYLLIIFSIPTCRWDPTTSHDYQAGERDYSWCFCETMASFSARPYFDENGDTYFQYLLCYTNCHPIIIAVHLSSREPIFALDCRLLLSHQSCQKYHLRNISREIPHLLPDMATDGHIEKIENRVVEEEPFAK